MNKRMLRICGTAVALGLLTIAVVFLPAGTSRAQSTVTVTNTSATPLFVEDVDNPARQPFAVRLCNGTVGGCGNIPHFITIPSSGRTTIEQVSGQCNSDSLSSVVVVLQGTVAGIPGVRTVLPQAPSAALGSPGLIIPATLVRMYPDPGTSLSFSFSVGSAQSGSHGTLCHAWIMGYTIKP
jgi:hypothetical protein